ncbi:zinc finger protein 239-like [Cyprinodon tularosa]|uniref:zinc finger protein 239-like n=1 Tax=Cyprinodon tularosa TaxID=77115 RepID=UPI0018E2825A|nr:zinc finger protein 239-like [Cyprinodon tularosa]
MKNEETALHLSMSQQSVPDSKKIFMLSSTSQQDLKTEEGEIESDVHFSSDEEEGLAGYRESNPDYGPHKQTREEKSSSNKSDFQESTKGEHACNTTSSGENDKDTDKPERKTPKMRRKKEGWKNSKKIRSCTVCGVTYRNLGNLLKHTLNHPLNPQNICGACGKGFDSEDNLKKHIRKHRKSYNCLHCDKSFFSRESLRCHIIKVTGENLLECNVCSKRFPSQKRLNQHRWIHLENKPYRCDMCPQSFGLESRLRAHRKRHSSKVVLFHTGETPYKCNECKRRFKSKNQLTQHMKTHSGIKDFICSICGKGSSKPEHLKIHMRTHTGERPYKCSLCDKAFTQSHCLKKHMKTHQTEESPAIPPATEDGSFSPK